ncbi:MAG: helix-turn-helix domain-containing protein [Ruminococcus sp.]|nr:helix-turn-helix domain-containing protein [Ruminococcus sp.]
MTFGQKVKLRREELGLAQTELASKAHISQPYLSQLENNVFNPTAPMIIRLAVALEVSIDYLLLDDKNRAKNKFLTELERRRNYGE